MMNKSLNIVHIGKCGGTTVREAIAKSQKLRNQFNTLKVTHVSKPIYNPSENYLFIIRSPISRTLSSFNWRKYLMHDQKQRDRFLGERQVLEKYDTLENIAENLYCPESRFLNLNVDREFQMIHHIRENISFYLYDLLKQIKPDQIYGVIKQHSINSDCSSLLGVDSIEYGKKNGISSFIPPEDQLSSLALVNLRRYLVKDYECLIKLWSLNALAQDDLEILLAS